ncbi:hypothetical protein AB1Y20_007926 [Prymnesium parvum]
MGKRQRAAPAGLRRWEGCAVARASAGGESSALGLELIDVEPAEGEEALYGWQGDGEEGEGMEAEDVALFMLIPGNASMASSSVQARDSDEAEHVIDALEGDASELQPVTRSPAKPASDDSTRISSTSPQIRNDNSSLNWENEAPSMFDSFESERSYPVFSMMSKSRGHAAMASCSEDLD